VGTGAPAGSDAVIRVEALTGPAWSRGAAAGETAESRALEIGEVVGLGSVLITAEKSRAAIRLASGHSVRLDASTEIRLNDAGSLALERGAVYVDSGPGGAAADSLDVRTPLGVIEEIGTQFESRVQDDSLRVRLREGAVIVHHDDRSHEVQAGTELALEPDGSVVRRAVPVHGPEWAWIVDVTPTPDFEGRPARSFLDWVARERGWSLAFADDSVARSADSTLLGGTIERLSLEEALDAVLPTCRMSYRVEEAVLVIEAAP
jgi:ferric-dicitrate binding protein FerR (iron transport regulator)